MKYMLDTNICIYIIKKKPLQVINRLTNIEISDIGISSITLSELEYGVEKSQKKEQNKLALTQFLTPFEIKAYNENSAQIYGKIRSELEKRGTPIDPLYLLIAAHAISLGSILVTNNEKEFQRVPGLIVENWVY